MLFVVHLWETETDQPHKRFGARIMGRPSESLHRQMKRHRNICPKDDLQGFWAVFGAIATYNMQRQVNQNPLELEQHGDKHWLNLDPDAWKIVQQCHGQKISRKILEDRTLLNGTHAAQTLLQF